VIPGDSEKQYATAARQKAEFNRKDPFVVGGGLDDDDLDTIESHHARQHEKTQRDLGEIKDNLSTVSEAMQGVLTQR
jgi:hypothetical protein